MYWLPPQKKKKNPGVLGLLGFAVPLPSKMEIKVLPCVRMHFQEIYLLIISMCSGSLVNTRGIKEAVYSLQYILTVYMAEYGGQYLRDF